MTAYVGYHTMRCKKTTTFVLPGTELCGCHIEAQPAESLTSSGIWSNGRFVSCSIFNQNVRS